VCIKLVIVKVTQSSAP